MNESLKIVRYLMRRKKWIEENDLCFRVEELGIIFQSISKVRNKRSRNGSSVEENMLVCDLHFITALRSISMDNGNMEEVLCNDFKLLEKVGKCDLSEYLELEHEEMAFSLLAKTECKEGTKNKSLRGAVFRVKAKFSVKSGADLGIILGEVETISKVFFLDNLEVLRYYACGEKKENQTAYKIFTIRGKYGFKDNIFTVLAKPRKSTQRKITLEFVVETSRELKAEGSAFIFCVNRKTNEMKSPSTKELDLIKILWKEFMGKLGLICLNNEPRKKLEENLCSERFTDDFNQNIKQVILVIYHADEETLERALRDYAMMKEIFKDCFSELKHTKKFPNTTQQENYRMLNMLSEPLSSAVNRIFKHTSPFLQSKLRCLIEQDENLAIKEIEEAVPLLIDRALTFRNNRNIKSEPKKCSK
eukprot:snap_masked-scaffold_12-processed-gene-4.19-mRNA-1 protein AED:1.00 eAED:1.00 QI:0/0/0/0/1/1/2/0/417